MEQSLMNTIFWLLDQKHCRTLMKHDHKEPQ